MSMTSLTRIFSRGFGLSRLCLVGLLVLLAPTLRANSPDHADYRESIAIESAMRTWQERYQAATGRTITWPRRIADGKLPGLYPEDGFYHDDLLKDETTAAALVRTLAESMTEVVPDPVRSYLVDGEPVPVPVPVLSHFILTPETNDKLAGQSYLSPVTLVFARKPILNFDIYEDVLPGSGFTGITSANYHEKFQQIGRVLVMLDRPVFTPTHDPHEAIRFVSTETIAGVGTDEDCATAKQAALDELRSGGNAASTVLGLPSLRVINEYRQVGASNTRTANLFWVAGYFEVDPDKLRGRATPYFSRNDVTATASFYQPGNFPAQYAKALTRLGGVITESWTSPVFSPPAPSVIDNAAVPCPTTPDSGNIDEGWEIYLHLPVEVDWEHHFAPAADCSSCSDCENAKVKSLEFSIGLGSGREGSYGSLVLHAERPYAGLLEPAAWRRLLGKGVRAVTDYSRPLRALEGDYLGVPARPWLQLQSADWVVDSTTDGPTRHTLRFFSRPALPAAAADTGLVDVSAATPYVTYLVEGPSASAEQVVITVQRPSITRVYIYNYDAATDAWTLLSGTGAEARSETVSWSHQGPAQIETRTIRDVAGEALLVREKHYRVFPWNDPRSAYETRRRELVAVIDDPDGARLTTRYAYYDDEGVDRESYGRRKSVEYHDGSWERHVYDRSGGLARIVRPYLDSPVTAPESEARVTEEITTHLADIDGDGQPERLVTWIERILGQEVSRNHTLIRSSLLDVAGVSLTRTDRIACQVPGAAWDHPANLVTIERAYATGEDAGKLHSVIRPDGTLSLTRYLRDDDTLTTISESGAPDANHTSVVSGRRFITVTDLRGVTRTAEERDIATGLLLDRRETLPDEIDEEGRVLAVHHLDGTTETFTYDCCGLASSTDRAGVPTFFHYDSLRRRDTVERAGVTERTVLDAAGRVREQHRTGSDGSTIVTARNTYDLAGRLVSTRDALDRLTRFREDYLPSGRRRSITTLADQTEIIEEYHRDGRLAEISGTAAHPRRQTYDVVTDTHDGLTFAATTTRTILLGDADAETEWTETFTDMLGRGYKSVLPAFSGGTAPAPHLNFYNLQGQLARTVSADGIVALYAYDAEGRLATTAIDADGDDVGLINPAGADRITTTTRSVLTDPERGIVERSTLSLYFTADDPAPTLVGVTDVNHSTNTRWTTSYDRTAESRLEFLGGGVTRAITRGPDGVVRTELSADGRPSSSTTVNSVGEVLQSMTYAYDPHGRLETTTDARNGDTTYAYHADDSLHSVTSPAPSADEPRQTTSYTYDALGRVFETVLPDGARAFTDYYPTGEIRRTHGGRQYPVDYTYDRQGRLRTLTTWKDHAAQNGAAVTTWDYDPARGALLTKVYPQVSGLSSQTSYTYTPAGRLHQRTWARDVTTTYAYDPAFGDLTGVTYSAEGPAGGNTTPAVAYTYDRAGRPDSVTDAAGQREFAYLDGLLRTETHVTGDLAGHVLTRGYDTARLASLQLTGPAGQLHAVGYDYRDSSDRDLGRLAAVTTGDLRVAYAYTPQSPLPATTAWTRSGALRQTTTHTWDKLNRLVEQRTAAGPLQRGTAYAHNLANQRTRATLPDGEYWDYEYDELGQLKSGEKRLPTAETVPGYSFGYAFDDIGNRRSTVTNGRSAAYSANEVNQYETREVPRVVDLLGEAPSSAAVTVNTVPALLTAKTDPALNYFYSPYPAEETGRHVFTLGSRVAGPPEALYDEQRVAYQPPPVETFVHDDDGNLTDDWRWRYTWDAENRLVQMDTQAAAIAAGVPHQRILYRYDSQSRRIRQIVAVWDESAQIYAVTTDLRYLYDGWNLLAEIDATGAIVRRHTWGRDLSGGLQGAGGVGGLLATEIEGEALLPAYDGNGNLLSLVNATNGTLAADYEYDPFGTTLKAVGPHAQTNPWRFSTKYTDNVTGLVYYGFRYYNSSAGRWLSRDPIAERGGLNLYGMVNNRPSVAFDLLGMRGATATARPMPVTGIPGTMDGPPLPPVPAGGVSVGNPGSYVGPYNSNSGYYTIIDAAYDLGIIELPYVDSPDLGFALDTVPGLTAALSRSQGQPSLSAPPGLSNPSTGTVDQADDLRTKLAKVRGKVKLDQREACSICPQLSDSGWITYLDPWESFPGGPQAKGVAGAITPLTPTGTSAGINPKGWAAIGDIVGGNRARGHLLSRQNGGSGSTIRNIVPLQHSPFNNSDMRKIEIAMYQARQKATVCFFIMPKYSGQRGDQGIPFEISIIWVSSDGKTGTSSLNHAPGN